MKAVRHPDKSTKIRMLTATAMLSLLSSTPSLAETRGFVVSFFHTATLKDEKHCTQVFRHGELLKRGYSKFFTPEEREEIAKHPLECLTDLTVAATRGIIDGKLANIYHYPESDVEADYFQTYEGEQAYGFDLDGKDADDDDGFIDPETGAKGVDNQLFRAIGCFPNYNIDLPNRPRNEDNFWRRAASGRNYGAWLFTITTDDFSKDGPATINFYRGVDDLRKNVTGAALADVTYVIDPEPRTHGEFKGEIKDGVFISGSESADLSLTGANVYYPEMAISRARLRLTLNTDRTVNGYIGGYRPWKAWWHSTAMSNEANTADLAALYHNLQQTADADPDPETGANRAISVTYRIESVPAFVAQPDGTLVADVR